MAVGCPVGTRQVRVLLGIPAVELEDEAFSAHESVIDPAMGMVRFAALQPQQGRVPGAAGRHVADRNQGLRSDPRSSRCH